MCDLEWQICFCLSSQCSPRASLTSWGTTFKCPVRACGSAVGQLHTSSFIICAVVVCVSWLKKAALNDCHPIIASCALDIVHPIFWFSLNGGFVGGGGGGEGQRDWFPPPLPPNPDRPTPPSIAGEGKPRTERVLSSRRFWGLVGPGDNQAATGCSTFRRARRSAGQLEARSGRPDGFPWPLTLFLSNSF